MRFGLLVAISFAGCTAFTADVTPPTANAPDAGIVDGGSASADASTPPSLANDSFERTRTSDLGDAEKGGHWVLTGKPAFSVANGKGSVSITPGDSGEAYLDGLKLLDVDESVTVTSAQFGDPASKAYVTIESRRADALVYVCTASVQADGQLALTISTGLTANDALLGAKTGLAPGPNDAYRVRFVTQGANPTMLRCRAWNASSTEPSDWVVELSDATLGLQIAGRIGLRFYLSQTATVDSVIRVDDFVARTP